MARPDPYVDVPTLKALVQIQATDERADAALLAKLKAASRQVDNWTGRFFGRSDPEALVFWPDAWDRIEVDELVSASEVAIDAGDGSYGVVLDPGEYRLGPAGASTRGLPFTEIRAAYGFPSLAAGVRITGVWGWPAVPEPVKEATALQANRLWKRASAPFGVTGSPELGQMTTISSLDPDVKALLAPYRVLAV